MTSRCQGLFPPTQFKKEKPWERGWTGRDGIVRGATVRVIMKGKPVRLSRPVQKLYPLEFRSEGEGPRTTGIFGIQRFPQEESLLEMQL